jgi:hypothetical protein
MSLVKAKLKEKDVLNFSSDKISKRYIRQALRRAEVIDIDYSDNDTILINNYITVGMYKIRIIPSQISTTKRTRLKEYGGFCVEVWEQGSKEKWIDIRKDPLFRDQNWIEKSWHHGLYITHLVDVILHCSRLNKLRAFN